MRASLSWYDTSTDDEARGMEQELIAYLEEIRENSRQIQEQLAAHREETAQRFAEVDRQFAASREETAQQFAASREETNRRFERIEGRMEEGFRHTGVEIEGLYDKIQQVAEGVAVANERLDMFQKETTDKLENMRSEMLTLVGEAFKEIRALKTQGFGLGRDQEGPAPTT